MIRCVVVLLGIVLIVQPGDAIKCYECSSLNNRGCEDKFTNTSMRATDCSQIQVYDLTPIEFCRKIKYKENDRSIYMRGCNIKDNIQLRDAKVFLCNTNYCNSAINHRPTVWFTLLLFASFVFIKVLRV